MTDDQSCLLEPLEMGSHAVRLTLTDDGARRLRALSELHIGEPSRLARAMRPLATDLGTTRKPLDRTRGGAT